MFTETLLPLFRVAFTFRDARGQARGGAAQVRAKDANGAAASAHALYPTVTDWCVVAVAAA